MSCKDLGEDISKEQAMTREITLVDQNNDWRNYSGSGARASARLIWVVILNMLIHSLIKVNEKYAEGK